MPSATPPLLDALRDLADLSRLDSELRALEIEKTEFPARVVACAERRSSSEARLAASRERVTEVEQEQRRQEGEARDQEALLEKLEAQQHQVKTNKEYSALLLEMERAREAISTAETSVLEAMEALETARLGLADGEREVASLLEGIAEEERGIEARSHSVQETIEELRVRRGGWGTNWTPKPWLVTKNSPRASTRSWWWCRGRAARAAGWGSLPRATSRSCVVRRW